MTYNVNNEPDSTGTVSYPVTYMSLSGVELSFGSFTGIVLYLLQVCAENMTASVV
jgi:hypothetical protein